MTDAAATPIARYRELLASGELSHDTRQELAVEKLQLIHHRLARYDPRPAGWRGLFRRRGAAPPPRGLYLHGGVGRGKTMLMDLFFETVPAERKRRTHFHAFMAEVHARIDRFRKTDPEMREGDDPIPPLAAELAEEAWLLCFDELEVRDIADAMILGRLFTKLFEHGVVLVATSNQAPGQLYEGGLNRQLFLPVIDLLKDRLDILHLDGVTDYRLRRLATHAVYHAPLDRAASAALDQAFLELTDVERGVPATIPLKGRGLAVPEQARGVARFHFDDLCARPLGSHDYLAICEVFTTLIVAGIPKLGSERRNEARRFITLIDILYDNSINLVCSAATAPEAIYPDGEGNIAFHRTASRLVEMQSRDYIEAPRTTTGGALAGAWESG